MTVKYINNMHVAKGMCYYIYFTVMPPLVYEGPVRKLKALAKEEGLCSNRNIAAQNHSFVLVYSNYEW